MARSPKKNDGEMENPETTENGVTGDTATDMAIGDGALESNVASQTADASALTRDNGTEAVDPAVNDQMEEPEPIAAEPGLETISAMAARHRVPSWHLAALLRFMDWEDDRLVSDNDFRMALARLNSRRIGGGRM